MAKLKIKAQVRGGHLKNWSDESIIGMSLPPNAEEALVKKKKKIYEVFLYLHFSAETEYCPLKIWPIS